MEMRFVNYMQIWVTFIWLRDMYVYKTAMVNKQFYSFSTLNKCFANGYVSDTLLLWLSEPNVT